MSEQSRKVLEEIQKAKSHLLKQGAAASLGNFGQPSPVGGGGVGGLTDVHMTPSQRSAMQTLQQTNASSFGFFVYQESHFGNSILPVLPRLDPPTTKPI